MNEWIKLIKRKVGNDKYPTLKRIKAGKILMGVVALPLGTSVLFPVAAAMMMPLKPSVWAKSKLNDFQTWRRLL